MLISIDGSFAQQFAVKGPIPKGYYRIDFYIPCHKLAIEFDEPYHYIHGILRDQDILRQKYIEEKLGCTFLRIKEKDFLDNPEKCKQLITDKINHLTNNTALKV